MAKGLLTFENFNTGGMSDSKLSGIKDSSYKLVGIDLHTIPGQITARQKLAKISGDVVTEFCKNKVDCSDGKKYWFSATSGKIWCDNNGTITLIYTTVPTRGNADCLGAREYGGYIYWATQSYLHRIAIHKTSDWTTNAEANWKELDIDQEIVGTGQTYTLATSIAETATHRQTFTPEKMPQMSFTVNISEKGTGDWTFTIHDASNNVIATKTITNANLTTGVFRVTFDTPWIKPLGSAYHLHIHSSIAGGKVVTGTLNDLETCAFVNYTYSDDTYHPMMEQNLVLFIGDRNFVHQVDTYDAPNEFTKNALDIPYPWRIKSLGTFRTDLLVGAFLADTVNTSMIFRWDTSSPSFINQHQVFENGINAFFASDTVSFVQCGRYGNIYVYNGETLELYRKIPGTYTPAKYGVVHPEAVANLDGMMLFGFSNQSGNPTESAVWVLGHHDRNYPFVMDISFPISERDEDGGLVLEDVEIGAIMVSGYDLYVSWKHGDSVGIDKLDYTAKIEKAYVESRIKSVEREMLQTASELFVAFTEIPEDTSITAYLSANYKPYVQQALTLDVDRNILRSETSPEGTTFQLLLLFNVTGNDSPAIESAAIRYQ